MNTGTPRSDSGDTSTTPSQALLQQLTSIAKGVTAVQFALDRQAPRPYLVSRKGGAVPWFLLSSLFFALSVVTSLARWQWPWLITSIMVTVWSLPAALGFVIGAAAMAGAVAFAGRCQGRLKPFVAFHTGDPMKDLYGIMERNGMASLQYLLSCLLMLSGCKDKELLQEVRACCTRGCCCKAFTRHWGFTDRPWRRHARP